MRFTQKQPQIMHRYITMQKNLKKQRETRRNRDFDYK